MARDASSLGLNSLGATDFKAFGRSVGVQRHILGLERGWTVAILFENAAKGSGNDALAHIAASPSEHNGM
jgi:hypothetical protein